MAMSFFRREEEKTQVEKTQEEHIVFIPVVKYLEPGADGYDKSDKVGYRGKDKALAEEAFQHALMIDPSKDFDQTAKLLSDHLKENPKHVALDPDQVIDLANRSGFKRLYGRMYIVARIKNADLEFKEFKSIHSELSPVQFASIKMGVIINPESILCLIAYNAHNKFDAPILNPLFGKISQIEFKEKASKEGLSKAALVEDLGIKLHHILLDPRCTKLRIDYIEYSLGDLIRDIQKGAIENISPTEVCALRRLRQELEELDVDAKFLLKLYQLEERLPMSLRMKAQRYQLSLSLRESYQNLELEDDWIEKAVVINRKITSHQEEKITIDEIKDYQAFMQKLKECNVDPKYIENFCKLEESIPLVLRLRANAEQFIMEIGTELNKLMRKFSWVSQTNWIKNRTYREMARKMQDGNEDKITDKERADYRDFMQLLKSKGVDGEVINKMSQIEERSWIHIIISKDQKHSLEKTRAARVEENLRLSSHSKMSVVSDRVDVRPSHG